MAAETCEHRIPSLIFRIDEQPAVLIDSEKLRQLDYVPGPWLGKLKRRFFCGAEEQSELLVLKRQAGGIREVSVAKREFVKKTRW